MSQKELVVVIVASIGTVFLLISSIGIVRLPGVHARMHAVGKAATLGISAVLLSAGFYFGDGLQWLMMLLALLFFITSPVATSAIARAAYRRSPKERRYLVHNDMTDPKYHASVNQIAVPEAGDEAQETANIAG